MATFLLVHGAWHGGWCWAKLMRELRASGHEAHAPTLTGLGDRSHLLEPGITADTHVADIVNYIRWWELKNVVLVGHSYGGMVITGVAGQVPEALSSLVYLDAFVPEESGVSLFAKSNPERMAQFQRQIDAGAIALDPDNFDAWSDDESVKDWLRRQCTPHPVGCFQEGVSLTGRENEVVRRYFILCARNEPSPFWPEYEKVKDRENWRSDKIATKHNAMVEAPAQLAELLTDFADTVDA